MPTAGTNPIEPCLNLVTTDSFRGLVRGWCLSVPIGVGLSLQGWRVVGEGFAGSNCFRYVWLWGELCLGYHYGIILEFPSLGESSDSSIDWSSSRTPPR